MSRSVPLSRLDAGLVDLLAADVVTYGERLPVLAQRTGRVAVCGGGLTGIEIAAEVAERFPALQVTLVSSGRSGAWLSPKAQVYLTRTFEALGVTVRTGARVQQAHADEMALDDGVQFLSADESPKPNIPAVLAQHPDQSQRQPRRPLCVLKRDPAAEPPCPASLGHTWVRDHCWLVPVPQVYCSMSTPSPVPAPTTSRHLPLCRAMSWK